jgi:hypothetical protein
VRQFTPLQMHAEHIWMALLGEVYGPVSLLVNDIDGSCRAVMGVI